MKWDEPMGCRGGDESPIRFWSHCWALILVTFSHPTLLLQEPRFRKLFWETKGDETHVFLSSS